MTANTNRFMENPPFLFEIIIEVDFQENKEM